MVSQPKNPPEYLNITQAAALLNVSKGTIRRWTNAGKLPCSRVGGRKERRFLEKDLRKLLEVERRRGEPGSRDNANDDSGRHRCVLCDDSSNGWDAIVEEIAHQNALQAHITFVADSARKRKLTDSLHNLGTNLQAEISAGNIRMLTLDESYLLSGQFSGGRAAAFVESTILYAKSLGFERSLFVGWSDWTHEFDQLDSASLMCEVLEYERTLARMLRRYPTATILCPYAAAILPSEALVELASCHTEIQFQSQRVYGLAD